jgi:hypothetical protein
VLDWDGVQQSAETQGVLVYAMDQTQTRLRIMEKMPPGPWGVAPPHGSCAGIALRWIGLRQQGTDYPYDPKTRWYSAPYWEAVRDQYIVQNTKGNYFRLLDAVNGIGGNCW